MVEVPPEVEQVSKEYSQLAEPAAWGFFAFVIAYLVGQLFVRPAVMRVIRRRNERNLTLVEAIGRYTQLGVLVVAAIVGLAFSGYGDILSGSAIVIAAATLAIGVAGQAVIGNLVSGMFLVVDPDFNVGDWIEWDGGAGIVETIRFRVTRVRTGDFEVMTVPNTKLATSAVTRPYSRNRLRLAVSVGVPAGADVDEMAAILREEAVAMAEVRETPPPSVATEGVADGMLDLRVRFWLDDPSRGRTVAVRSAYVQRLEDRLAAKFGTDSYPAVQVRIDGGFAEGP